VSGPDKRGRNRSRSDADAHAHAVLTMKVFKHSRRSPATKAGITFRPVAQKSCRTTRIGVIGVFTPPVTG